MSIGLARDSVGLPQEKKVTGMDMMKVREKREIGIRIAFK